MLLKQKVVLISREVIERARQRDEQTEVLTEVLTPFFRPYISIICPFEKGQSHGRRVFLNAYVQTKSKFAFCLL